MLIRCIFHLNMSIILVGIGSLVINPHKETTYVLDPMKNPTHFKEVKIITEMAIKMFNNTIGKWGRQSQVWEVIKFFGGPYSKEEIDDVQRDWTEFVYEFIDNNDDENESELDG